MSPRAAAEFTKKWPAIERRLVAFLRSKRVSGDDVDDVAQEVATRLLSVWHKVDRARDPWPLVVTIALNLLRDRSRKRIFEIFGELPDVPGNTDAAEAGIARVELGEVFRAMEKLTTSQRAALLRALEPSREEVTSTAADKMLRMRARRRLADAVGRASAGLVLRLRRTSETFSAFLTKTDGMVQALACASCLFITTAGAATLAPGFVAAGESDGISVVTAATVNVDSLGSREVDYVTTGSTDEQLRPQQASPSAKAPRQLGEGHVARSDKPSDASGVEAAGSSLTLPTNPLPNGDEPMPVPEPPDPGGAPPAPSTPDVEGDLPQSPVQPPTPDADEIVEEVTGTLTKSD